MDYVKKRTHIINHPRFLKAGAVARDLYDWGMLHSGLIESDGELDMVAVLSASWGYGGKANIRAAVKLVEVGLWERTDTGFRILKWAEQGNVTKATLEQKREADREKKRRQRLGSVDSGPRNDACPHGTPQGTPQGSPAGIGTSPSTSPSGSALSAENKSLTVVHGEVPAFFIAAAATAEGVVGRKVDQLGARWVEYEASRDRKRWGMGHKDAAGWLTAVMRSEAREGKAGTSRKRGAEITKQPYEDDAPWLKAAGGDE